MRGQIIDDTAVSDGWSRLPSVLSRFGWESLRPGQEEAVSALICGVDTICVLPTGTGKTGCFAVPTLCMGYRTLVFSPLIALMRDQLRGLWKAGVAVRAINSSQSQGENDEAIRMWMRKELEMLYVAPERLNDRGFRTAIGSVRPDMVVVDEAHTCSAWSDNFRPSYVLVGEVVDELSPKVVAAFTATCPREVEADVRRVLKLPDALKVVHYPRRSNLLLASKPWKGDFDLVDEVVGVKGPCIVYCATVKRVEETASILSSARALEDKVVMYHGRLPPDAARSNQDLFMSGECDVIVATNAFGMGVDKANIRGVIHREYPGSLEALSQEVGRGGRDGLPCRCLTYADPKAKEVQLFFIENDNPSPAVIKRVYECIERAVDSEGVCRLTNQQVSDTTGESTMKVASAIAALVGAGAIARAKSQEGQVVRMVFLDTPKDKAMAIPYSKLLTVMESYGVPSHQGGYEIHPDVLVSKTERSMATVRKWLKDLGDAGCVRAATPYRGAETAIAGPLSLVDFTRLERKRTQAFRKLKDVETYLTTPDKDKHTYLENYFQHDVD